MSRGGFLMAIDTSVLIVGGSLNGLSTGVLLAHPGLPCAVVERHSATTVQYKFRGISARSMEIYRAVGIEDDIRSNQTGDQRGGGLARVKNLADPQISWMPNDWADTEDISPAL